MGQGLSAIEQDVAPYMIAAGLNRIAGINSVGLRRANLEPAKRKAIKQAFEQAFELVFQRGMNLPQALPEAKKTSWDEAATRFFDFPKKKSHRRFCLHSWLDSEEKREGSPEKVLKSANFLLVFCREVAKERIWKRETFS